MVTHKPTELVVSTGKAEFTPLTDDLLAMSNTDSDVFMDVKSQKYYLIISGRWYKADSMTGTWQYVAADKLPATFVEIPKNSKYTDVQASVAGTDEIGQAGKIAAAGGGAALGAATMKNQTDRPASGKQLSTSDMQNKAANLNSQSRPNNIITDEKGNVLRNSNGQWQEQNNGQWQDRTASAKTEKAKSSVQQRSGYELSSSIDRQQHSRQRTTTRMQSPSRPSRSSFGGGGGRR